MFKRQTNAYAMMPPVRGGTIDLHLRLNLGERRCTMMSAMTKISMLAILGGIFLTLNVSLLPSEVLAQGRRINFDERLVKGQTAKANAVYIFDHRTIRIDSLVKQQRRFRKKVIKTVFPN